MAQSTRIALDSPNEVEAHSLHQENMHGEHTIKANFIIHYALERLVPKKHEDKGKKEIVYDDKQKKDLFKKFYVTYAFGSSIEGKTDALPWNTNNWQTAVDVHVNTNLLSDIYECPTTFTVWEIIRTDSTDRQTIQLMYKKLGNAVNMRKGGWASLEARKLSIEALQKRKFSLANIGLTRRPSSASSRKGRKSIKEEETASLRRKMSHKRFNESYFDGNADVILERDFLSRLSDRGGLSDSELDSRPQSRMKSPRSESRFSSGSSRSGRETPHPHHYDHPEKHVPWEYFANGMVKSRSSSSLVALGLMRPKTPPSPHHHTHPLNMYAPSGTTFTTQTKGKLQVTKLTKEAIESKQKERMDLIKSKSSKTSAKKKPSDMAKETDESKQDKEPKQAVHFEQDVNQSSDVDVLDHPDPLADQLEFLQKKKPKKRVDSDSLANNRIVYTKKGKPNEFTHVPVAQVSLDIIDLFLGRTELTEKIEDGKIQGMKNCSVSIKLSEALLSPEQSLYLNPMVIQIGSGENMPSNPITFQHLDKLCQPVFCRFKFFGDPYIHESATKNPHGKIVEFNTRHLVLPGLIDEDNLRDDLINKKLTIEVHDRDYRLPDDLNTLSNDFGSDGYIKTKLNPPTPYGIASFSLNELAYGCTELEFSSQITPKDLNNDDSSLPCGHWLENTSTLSIKVNVQYPILAHPLQHMSPLNYGQFYRMIIIADYGNELFEIINSFIDDTNAYSLGLEGQPLQLATCKLTLEQTKNRELDLINGYHVFDESKRILFLEGLKSGNLPKLYLIVKNHKEVKVIYSPELSFSDRLWTFMNPGLCHIKLNKSLDSMLGSSPVALQRSSVKGSHEILGYLKELQVEFISMESKLARFPTCGQFYNLLNQVGELVSLEESFHSVKDQADDPSSNVDEILPVKQKRSITRKKVLFSPVVSAKSKKNQKDSKHPYVIKRIEDVNEAFDIWKKHQKLHIPNFVAIHAKTQQERTSSPPDRSTQTQVYNYSIQKKSATATQLGGLRKKLEQDPKHIHVYGSQLYSQVLGPVDIYDEIKRIEKESMSKWKTKQGFWTGPFK